LGREKRDIRVSPFFGGREKIKRRELPVFEIAWTGR